MTDITSHQFPAGVPVPAQTEYGSDLVVAPLDVRTRLDHFFDAIYDLSPDSHLFRFAAAVLGDSGANGLRKRYLMSRLSQTLQGTRFYDLDRFYGALFGIQRKVEELLPINPYTEQATAAQWNEIIAADGSYRSRIEQFAKALSLGGTALGMKAVAESILSCQVDILENYTRADNPWQSYEDIADGFATYDDMEDETYTELSGSNPIAFQFQQTYDQISTQYSSYEDMESVTYFQLVYGDFTIDNNEARNLFVIIPHRAITDSERHNLLRAIHRVKPADSLVEVEMNGPTSLLTVPIFTARASSSEWKVKKRVTPVDGKASVYGLNEGDTLEEIPSYATAASIGDEWSYLGDVAAVGSYREETDGSVIQNYFDMMVWDTGPNKVISRYEAAKALKSYGNLLRGRMAQDGNLFAAPFDRARFSPAPQSLVSVNDQVSDFTEMPAANVTPLEIEGMDLQGLKAAQSSGDLRYKTDERDWAGDRFWATPARPMGDGAEEAVEIVLHHPRRINYISCEVAHYPQEVTLQAWSEENGEWVSVHNTHVFDSYPQRLTSRVDGWRYVHPHHAINGHWVDVDARIDPVEARRFRILLKRGNGTPPTGTDGQATDYSLAVRGFDIGFRILSETDVPSWPSGIDEIASSLDLLGSRVSMSVDRLEPEAPLEGGVWRSEPLPSPEAVVNYYLDVRTPELNGQVIDKLYLNPTDPGPTLNLYYSNDDTGVAFAPDSKAISFLSHPYVEFGDTGINFPEGGPSYPTSVSDPNGVHVSTDDIRFAISNGQAWWMAGSVVPHRSGRNDGLSDSTIFVDLQGVIIGVGPNGPAAFLSPSWLGPEFIDETVQIDVPDINWNAGESVTYMAGWDPKVGFTVRFATPYSESDAFVPVEDWLSDTTAQRTHGERLTFGSTGLVNAAAFGSHYSGNHRLRSFVLKDRLPNGVEEDDWRPFFNDAREYTMQSQYSPENDRDERLLNAVVRVNPSFGVDAPVIGGPGQFYSKLSWRPIPRDYRLQRGYIDLPPIAAKYWKMQFVDLVPESLDPIAGTSVKTMLMSSQTDKNASPSSGQYDYHASWKALAHMAPSDADVKAGIVTNVTSALYVRDPVIAQGLRKVVGGLGWRQVHLPSQTERWMDREGVHQYHVADIAYDKLAYRVGLKEVRAERFNYSASFDTDAIYERFYDTHHLTGTSWDLSPGRITSGSKNFVQAESSVFSSHTPVRALQFATQQTDAVQILPDDQFRDPGLTNYDWDFGDRWTKIGDAQIRYNESSQTITIDRNLSFLDFMPGRDRTFTHDPVDPVMSYIANDDPIDTDEGGIRSPLALASPRGMVHAAVRFTALTDLTNPIKLQIHSADGTLLAEKSITARRGETVEDYLSYVIGSYEDSTIIHYEYRGADHPVHPVFAGLDELEEGESEGGEGQGSIFYIQLVQEGSSSDTWEVDRLSLYDDSIVWEFSADAGETWIPALAGVKNNPNGAVRFAYPSTALRYRVTAYRQNMTVNSIQIRPWYGNLWDAPTPPYRGANVSQFDQYPPIHDDPEFKRWTKPVPREWWAEYERYPLAQVQGQPILTPFARFYVRNVDDSVFPTDEISLQNLVTSRFLEDTIPDVIDVGSTVGSVYGRGVVDSIVLEGDFGTAAVIEHEEEVITSVIPSSLG